ncbi:hypothetical protein EG68_03885 [Paragonimus skrjabini miyazakii]|uniref:Fibronectin type-III domain-containing protein n=1 Tax=Paragonimus skrjabini miyazakii TaxID=59628 RepID=A0A8S9YWD1_9TREM|nr:hypothetical protein EG68_03885 [Paragonimus skrjabini miyazakii]
MSDLWLFSFMDDELREKIKIQSEQTKAVVYSKRTCLRHNFLIATSKSYTENSILAYVDNTEMRSAVKDIQVYHMGTDILVKWQINEVPCKSDTFRVQLLDYKYQQFAETQAKDTSTVLFNNTSPEGIYHVRISWDVYSTVRNLYTHAVGLENVNHGVPAVPHVTDLGNARARVRWTTNPHCTPDLIHVHFREPSSIGLLKVIPGTDETTVITGMKQCIQYAIQLGFSYTTGKEYLSDPAYMTFLSDGTFHNAPKLSFDQNGSLLVQWLLRPGCIVNQTVVTVETNDQPAKEYNVTGDQPLARLNDLEPCAFHTVYVTIQYKNGNVERTNSSEIHSFTKEIGLTKIKTYIVDDVLLAHWESTQNCQALGYRVDLMNPTTGQTKAYLTGEMKYRVSIGECVKSCQLLVSAISVDTMVPVTTLIDVRPERVPAQPRPPFVRRDGPALFVWWTEPNLDLTIQSYKLFVNDSKKMIRDFEVKQPRRSILLNNIEENVVYSLNLRAINESGESQPSLSVQYKWNG